MKASRQILLVLLILFMGINLQAQVIISNNPNDEADTSAALEIRSTIKGLLPPRMTAAQRDAIVNPAPGLIIYCINCGDNGVLQLRHNYNWVDLLYGPLSPVNEPPIATNVTVSGLTIAGQMLTGSYSYSDAESNAEGTSVFKWYRADNNLGLNETLISNASGFTYTTTEADFLKYIRFAVIPMASIGTNPGLEVKSPWSNQILAGAPEAQNVTQTGNTTVGSILTGVYTYFNGQGTPEGSSIYKWYRADDAQGTNEILISSATSLIYTLTSADLGKYVRFAVIVVSQDLGQSHGTEVKADTYKGIITANLAPVASSVSQTGIAINGKTLVGSYAYSDFENDVEGTSVYRWFIADDVNGTNETQIDGANLSTYTLQTPTIGKYVRFSVTPVTATGTSPGLLVKSSTYIGPILNAVPEALNVALTGNVSTGSTLNGSYNYFDLENDAQSTVVYKWYRADNTNGLNEVQIEGQSSSQYILGNNDINRFVRFSVTPSASTGRSPGLEVKSNYIGSVIFEVFCGVTVLTSNINVGTMINTPNPQSNNGVVEKYCYNNLESNCIQFGGLYQWNEAMNYVPSTSKYEDPSTVRGICPAGYHLPSDYEFSRYEYCVETTFSPIGATPLATFQTSTGSNRGTNQGTKMKAESPRWDGNNTSGFTALPTGYVGDNYVFLSLGSNNGYWTATQASANYARSRLMGGSSIFRNETLKTRAYPVRCFKD